MAHFPPQYVTLTPNTPATISFTTDLARVEILNIDGTDEIWVRFGDGPLAEMQDGTYVVPATVGYLVADPETYGPTKVKLLSATALRVGVRGIKPS